MTRVLYDLLQKWFNEGIYFICNASGLIRQCIITEKLFALRNFLDFDFEVCMQDRTGDGFAFFSIITKAKKDRPVCVTSHLLHAFREFGNIF